MGCVNFKAKNGRLPGPRNPVTLAADTAFSINDVEALTELFKTMCNSIEPDGKISKEEFKLALFNDSQRQNLFADRIFSLFDLKQKGKIYFADFVKVFHVFHPDTPVEAKIDFSFKLYDLNGDGVIERQEVREMLVAILREFQHDPTDEELETVLDRTFLEADTNRDGNIDIDEWRVYVNRNPGAIKIMTIPYLREVTTIFPDFVFRSTVKDDQLVVFEQPGASTSTTQPGASTSTAQPAAQPGASTSTAQPGASTSIGQPAAQPGASTSTAQPAALPECSTSTAQPAALPECSTSTAQTGAQPECSTSTAQPGGSTSAAQPEAQPRRSSSTSSDEFRLFF
ncbi:unnamed protein product [Vicia faba]|uniref:Calcineurin B-like protein n=1 Tax=Vicia faba TaxID=3906 RepID=A0AAV1AIU1_VICFA|nr:unnamed protein product [Vicia faba]